MRNVQLKDLRNLLSKLTWRRAWNALLLHTSFAYSRWRRKNYHRGMPLSIAIEPTTHCNLRCPECPSGLRAFSRPTGMLTDAVFHQAIDQLSGHLLYLTFYFQGEPYLHPRFLQMVQYASQKKIYTATSTNAHYLTEANALKTVESGLDRLIVSVDGTTQETYEAYRIGGKLEKVIEGIKNVVEAKKTLNSSTPHVVLQFLVVRPNEHQIEEVQSLGASLGVDEVQLKTAQIYDYAQGSPLIPTIDRYARYRQQEDGSYAIKNPMDNSCWKMWHSCVITWDGKVVPCCFDKDAKYRLGDMQRQSFESIWKSTPYHRFRERILKGRKQIDICRNCTEGMQYS